MRKLLVKRKPTTWDRAVSIRQLAVMIKSGVSLERSLAVLYHNSANPVEALAWKDVLAHVMSGRSLSKGMAANSHVFKIVDVDITRAGEASASLVNSFTYLADLLEREVRLTRAVTAAVQYPMFLFVFCITGVVLLLQHVMPIFFQAFINSSQELPLITKILLYMTELINNSAFIAFSLFLITLTVFFGHKYLSCAQGRYQFQFFILRIPIIGAIFKQVLLARFCHTMSVLAKSGLPLVSSLEMAGLAMANYPLGEAVEKVSYQLKDGASLGSAFKNCSFFPSMVSNMLKVAEETSDIAGVLKNIAKIYEQQAQASLEQITVSLEPVMTAVIAIFIGSVLIGLFLPLYNYISTIA